MDYIKIDKNSKNYPKRLLKIEDAPEVLYAVGNIELLNKENTLGIIGSRNCTEYGRKYATKFALEISQNDICIISGMAIGIDVASHIGALNQKGKTIAVLGSGFNNIHPKENEWIFHKILSNCGCIITQFEPNVEPISGNFPKRNKIVSGISDAILVVEAEYRSGTSITAKFAKQQGKNIYCIPSNIDSISGIGTNNLIKQGANLVTKPEEIIKELKNNKQNFQITNSKIQLKNIKQEYLPVYQIISKEAIHINDICKKLDMSISQITPILTILELEGHIEQISSNLFKIKEE